MKVHSAAFGLAFALGLTLGSTPSTADGYAPVVSRDCCSLTWTGFYVGVNGGFAWSRNDEVMSVPTVFRGLAPEGGFGGGQIGYNWQSGAFLLGIEADIQGADIRDGAVITGVPFKSDLDWFGTVRGRLGYVAGRTLFYGTGGFAYGGIDNEFLFAPGVHFKSSGTATGYVIGAGIEHKFGPTWSVKAEYQYLNFGTNEPFFQTIPARSLGVRSEDDAFHTVRIGLNYQFQDRDRGYTPLK